MAERSPLSRWGEKGTGLRLASQFLAEQGSGRIMAVLIRYLGYSLVVIDNPPTHTYPSITHKNDSLDRFLAP